MGTTTTKERLTEADLEGLRLVGGGHGDCSNGLCFMEAVAWFAGERHTDHPQCVSPVIGAFGRTWNDSRRARPACGRPCATNVTKLFHAPPPRSMPHRVDDVHEALRVGGRRWQPPRLSKHSGSSLHDLTPLLPSCG